MFHKVKKFFRKIAKILDYLPLLWKDEDYDFSFILPLLKKKIERTRDCIRKNDIIVDSEIRDISIGINKTAHFIDCYMNPYESYDEYIGALSFNVGWTSYPCENGCYRQITINKDTGLPLTEEEEKEFREYAISSSEYEQKMWENIWDTIKKEGQKWWD